MPKTAYLCFLADAPLIGLDPHPAGAPDEVIESYDAEGYAKALQAYDDLAEAMQDVAETHQVLLDEVEAGNLEEADDPDMVFEVAIHDDGRIEVFHDNPRYVFSTFTIAQAYEAYGMKMPKKA